jgi:hypothetical protein
MTLYGDVAAFSILKLVSFMGTEQILIMDAAHVNAFKSRFGFIHISETRFL